MSTRFGCACCGREITGVDPVFCVECLPHVLSDHRIPPWDRTYFARFGESCPFQNPETRLPGLREKPAGKAN